MNEKPSAAEINAWTIEAGLNEHDVTPVIEGFVGRLADALPCISRILVGLPTLHPTYVSSTWTWERGHDVAIEHQEVGSSDSQDWLDSPIYQAVSQNIGTMRANLADPEEVKAFPVFRTFAGSGNTDYLLRLVPYEPKTGATGLQGVIVTFLSDRPDGFAPEELDLIEQVLPAFSLTLFRLTVSDVARGLLSAYLGSDAGRRVLGGKVTRGDVERINAAILVADFRHFTEISESLPVDRIIPWLNAGLSCIGDPITRHGGQILKFLGDGLLAIFPSADDDTKACSEALAAARDSIRELGCLSGDPAYRADFALHIGEVGYGNIGTSDRLDFTVIGPAVNEVSRMEKLCDSLCVHLVMSADFAAHIDAAVTDAGIHRLRGVREPRRLMTLTDC